MSIRSITSHKNNILQESISLIDILLQRAQNQGDRTAYIFLQNGETESGSLTYGELDQQAKAIASSLQSYLRGTGFIVISFWTGVYFGFLWLSVCWGYRRSRISSQTESEVISLTDDRFCGFNSNLLVVDNSEIID